jgi:hypothetical protein
MRLPIGLFPVLTPREIILRVPTTKGMHFSVFLWVSKLSVLSKSCSRQKIGRFLLPTVRNSPEPLWMSKSVETILLVL